MMTHRTLGFVCALSALAPAAAPAFGQLNFQRLDTFTTGIFDESAAEITTFDPGTQRLFVVNGNDDAIDILDLSNPNNINKLGAIDITPFGGGINSVAFQNGTLAAAVEANTATDPGSVVFFDAFGSNQNQVTVGALPDMLTFHGDKLLVANEGEPNEAYTVDPEGGVSIIDLSGGVGAATVSTAGFGAFNGATLDPSVRVFGPGATAAQDFEPEFIAVNGSGDKAFVALQENNALGVVDLNTNTVTDIIGLGFKDHSQPGNGLDANKNDGTPVIENLPIHGMFQPDSIATYEVGGETFIITANEGDARDFDGFSEEADLKDITLDPSVFSADFINRAGDTNDIGDLTVTTATGDADGDGVFEQVFAFGGRSFSIFREDGTMVFDSGDQFEQITANLPDVVFNADNDNNTLDNRSDNKGPEPEGVVLGEIGGRTFAFIGLERVSGVMVYDVTDPLAPVFDSYFDNRDFAEDVETLAAGDLGPEGLLFIEAADSPIGKPLLVVTNEVSGSTSVYAVPEPTTAALLLAGGTLLLRRRR